MESTDAFTYEECLVTACGDVVNVLKACTGELICSYTIPLDDVILHVDAVSVLTSCPSAQVIMNQSDSAAMEAPLTLKKSKKGRNQKTEVTEGGVEAATSVEAEVPLGSYVAVGTRLLQIYLFRIDAMEADVTSDPVVDESEVGAESPVKCVGTDIVYELHLLQNWTAAQQAISAVQFSPGGRYLISGSSDGVVKVWNAFFHYLTHNLRCPHSSLVQTIYLDPTERYLAVGSFEGHVTVFDFVQKKLIASKQVHVQAVEAITLTEDRDHWISVARDRRLAVLTISESPHELKEVRAVVVKEHVFTAVFESPSTLHIGSMDGVVATYSVSANEAVQVQRRLPKPPAANADDSNEESMVRALLVSRRLKGLGKVEGGFEVDDPREPSPLYVADAGFNIASVVPVPGTSKYTVAETLVGFLDQVLDIKVFPVGGAYDRVIVNNSKDVRLFKGTGCISSQVLQGHTDIVLCCAVSNDGRFVATAGKDMEVRFWSCATWRTVAIGHKGHIAEITSLCFNCKQSDSYSLLFSISADENLRMWDVGQHVLPRYVGDDTSAPHRFEHRSGVNSAHAGAVYALAVAPNDQYVATGGKDKMVHLWNITGKKVFRDGVLKGHRRGISSLAFSPTDRVLASSSNDGTVRLWSLVSLTCVKALQADKIPVLQLAFFNQGTQLVSGNAEGVLRVWAIAASEAVWSSELHEEKVWALQVMESEQETIFLTGSADGVLMATEDYTAEEVARLREDRHESILKEQSLANAIRRGEFSDAFLLALQLSHPRHLRQVLTKWSAKDTTLCEQTLRHELVPKLTSDQLLRLLQFTREWITNSRHCIVASLVLNSFLASHHFKDVAKLSYMDNLVEPLLAYSRRHSQRQHDLLRRTYYIDYVTRFLEPNVLTTLPPFVDVSESSTVVKEEHSEDASEPSLKRLRVS